VTAKVLALEGEIDFHLSPEVAASLRSIAARKPKRVVVDLAKVTYLDSSGLAALILGMQKTEEYGGEFYLAGMRPDVRSILETACLDQLFKILPGSDSRGSTSRRSGAVRSQHRQR
jgi:anti-anti-sigma factor